MTENLLQVTNLTKSYPSPRRGAAPARILDGVNLEVRRGEFFTIVGPSGAGKTTLLRCISGLLAPTSGEVLLAGRRVDGPPREIAPVFQDYSRSLYPWLSVERNVTLPLTAQRLPKEQVAARAAKALRDVGLDGDAGKYPWQLSGGMQQRVAIARALAYGAEVMVLDEPFASVDAQTRADLEDLLIQVKRETGATFLFVTHDVDEAVYLSDRVAVVTRSPSRIERVFDIGLPAERNQLDTKALPEFGRLRAEVFSTIRHLVIASSASSPDYSI